MVNLFQIFINVFFCAPHLFNCFSYLKNSFLQCLPFTVFAYRFSHTFFISFIFLKHFQRILRFLTDCTIPTFTKQQYHLFIRFGCFKIINVASEKRKHKKKKTGTQTHTFYNNKDKHKYNCVWLGRQKTICKPDGRAKQKERIGVSLLSMSLSFARLTYLVPYNTVNIIETFSSLSTLVAVCQVEFVFKEKSPIRVQL